MAKRRKERIDPAAKFVLIFVLIFVIVVAVLIPVMTRYSAQKLQESIDQAEAERQYLLDLSWIDSDMKLTWLARHDSYEQNEAGEWDYIGSGSQLRTYDFASGSFSDFPIGLGNAGDLILVPADDPRGYVLAERVGDYWSVFRINESGEAVRLLREKNTDVCDVIGFYDGRLYCDAYIDGENILGFNTGLFRWDSQTKETHRYRGDALCVSPDGRAVIEIERDTGLYETHYSWYDEDGKRMDKPIAKQTPIIGGVLGIEDARGNWQPLFNTGKDSAFYAAACAEWLDEDRLLFAANLPDARDTYRLYLCTLSRGEISPYTAVNGDGIFLHDAPIPGSMSVSPDGRYIAYLVRDIAFKYEAPAHLIMQSLETGHCARLSPRDDVIEGNLKKSVYVHDNMNHPIWTQ